MLRYNWKVVGLPTSKWMMVAFKRQTLTRSACKSYPSSVVSFPFTHFATTTSQREEIFHTLDVVAFITTDGLVTQNEKVPWRKLVFFESCAAGWLRETHEWNKKNEHTFFVYLVRPVRAILPPFLSLSIMLQSLAWLPLPYISQPTLPSTPYSTCGLFCLTPLLFLAFSLEHESRNQKSGGVTGDKPYVIRFKEITWALGCVDHQSVLCPK